MLQIDLILNVNRAAKTFPPSFPFETRSLPIRYCEFLPQFSIFPINTFSTLASFYFYSTYNDIDYFFVGREKRKKEKLQ